jgi:hypothetical protein
VEHVLELEASLSAFERKVVHEVAEVSGLRHESLGEGSSATPHTPNGSRPNALGAQGRIH